MRILILSGVLNLIFLGIFFYFLVRQNPFPITYEYTPSSQKLEKPKNFSNNELLKNYARLSYGQLISKLGDTTKVEDGYLARDLAISMLGSKYHFDVKRALGVRTASTRCVKLDEKNTVTLFPNLEDADYKKIADFVKNERFPLTNKGLFLTLKKVGIEGNMAMAQMFCRSSEFLTCEMLFQNQKVAIKKKWLLSLILEGKWETLNAFHETQKTALNLGDEGRREFLRLYLLEGSKTAAQFILLTDWEFAISRLEDSVICKLLEALPANSQRGALFAKELLEKPRSDLVHEKARQKLHLVAAPLVTPTPQPVSTSALPKPQATPAVKKPLEAPKAPVAQIRPPRAATGQLRPVQRNLPPSSPSPRQHVIQNGETLPTIAHKYNVSVEQLMQINHLPSQNIRTGNILRLP
jgi:LysM repeat protein